MAPQPKVRMTVSLSVHLSDRVTDLAAQCSQNVNQTVVDLLTIATIAVSEQFNGDLAAALESYNQAVPRPA